MSQHDDSLQLLNVKKESLSALLLPFGDGRYLDQLGMSARYDTKTYCRQSLIGGNYGLLNTTTYHPNPDYYRLSACSSLHVLNKFRPKTYCSILVQCPSVASVDGSTRFINKFHWHKHDKSIRALC